MQADRQVGNNKCLTLVAPSRSRQNSRRRHPHGESVAPSHLAPPLAGGSTSEEAHQSRTRAHIGRLEIDIFCPRVARRRPRSQVLARLVQTGLERDRLRAELRLMKARHLQLKQAIQLQGKASKKRAAMFSAREEPEPQVVVRREALATLRADVIVFQSDVQRLTSLLKAVIARKASSTQWMSTFARFTSEVTDFATSIHRWLENTRLASNVKR